MPTLLADAASRADLWTISAPTAANAMQVAYLKFNGKPGMFQLTSKAELGSVTTPWGPNVYKGTGNESRVTMTVNVPDAIREQMECIEEKVRDLLRPHVPKIDAIWHSSTKPSDKHPSSLRAKINVSGDRVCPCVDVDGSSVPLPTAWAGLSVIPVVSIKGAYIQKAMAGLLIEVSSLMIGDTVPKDNDVVAFL
jgi:hypothetical protein